MCHAKPPEGSPETAASNAHRWWTTRHPFPVKVLVWWIGFFENATKWVSMTALAGVKGIFLHPTAWNYSKIWLSSSFSFGGASFFFPCQSHRFIKQNPARAWQATPQRQVPPHQQVRTKQQPGRCFFWICEGFDVSSTKSAAIVSYKVYKIVFRHGDLEVSLFWDTLLESFVIYKDSLKDSVCQLYCVSVPSMKWT